MAITSYPPQIGLRSHDAIWDRARWERLPADGNRYEVIDGYLYMSTAPSLFHQWIIQELYASFRKQINETGTGLTFLAPIGVFMPGCDPVQPDVVVMRASDAQSDAHVYQKGRIEGVPALLVEVLSPSNAGVDLGIKRGAYARAGVPEYWIVRPATRDVLVCTHPDTSLGDYGDSHVFGPHDELVSPTLPVRVPVASLFAGAPDATP
ncbi:MAG: Uma2 family endonuclease [Chloroflexi bacterium]|nr:Uma2 family endonuclease [Chloroflexota bacterium]